METDAPFFVEQSQDAAKQWLGSTWVTHQRLGSPVGVRFTDCFRLEEEHSYRETLNRLKHMVEIRGVLVLIRDDLPD
ncbi:hypothetical protein ACLI4R_18505 [Natrialbaceae archaeon A-chndr2]